SWSCAVLMNRSGLCAEVTVDCGGDSVTVRWRLDSHQKLDPSKALLGSCPPKSTESGDTLLFSVSLGACGFFRQVTREQSNVTSGLLRNPIPKKITLRFKMLLIIRQSDYKLHFFFFLNGLHYVIYLHNSDFSAPAPALHFRLGSVLPVRAAVESRSRRPLWIYIESCLAATDPEISRAAHVHPIITNAGCLMESKWGNSSFLPRRRPAEMRLYLQAFKFALGQNVSIFLLCDLEAWDVQRMDQRACHYIQQQHRWELLDDPSQSYICSSCETSFFRRTDTVSGVYSAVRSV
uniref:ZP domain-containing protein n=1 Tax=Cyprinus carpio TaxID=7962 RepID=A0A8C1U201_CYPCA